MEELGWRPIPSGFDVEIVFPSGEEISLEDLYRCLLINETPAWRSRDLQRAFLFFRKLCTELHEGKIGNVSAHGSCVFQKLLTLTSIALSKSGESIPLSQRCILHFTPISEKLINSPLLQQNLQIYPYFRSI